MKKILVTGATGFLGGQIVDELLNSNHEIYLLVRKQSYLRAVDRFPQEMVKIVEGDLTNLDLLTNDEQDSGLKDKIDSIIHCGALYDFNASYEQSFMANVVGTQNVMHFAKQCKNLKEVHYVSTVAVSGDHEGVFKEEDFYMDQEFHNAYAQTKFDAEKVFRNTDVGKEIHRFIYRPGIILGDSQKGNIPKVDGPYFLIDLFLKMKGLSFIKVAPIPYNKGVQFPIIPVDHAAQFIKDIVNKECYGDEKLKVYHVISKSIPSFEQFAKMAIKQSGLNAKLIRLPFLPFAKSIFEQLNLPGDLTDYSTINVKYQQKNSLEDSNVLANSDASEYLERCLKGYIQNKGRG